MNKVYVVSTGEYSDWSIAGIFSTREMAQELVDHLKEHDSYNDVNDIDEWELDQPQENWPGVWEVEINEAGEVVNEYWQRYDTKRTPFIRPQSLYRKTRTFVGYDKDREAARRSAEELRRQTLVLEGKVIT